MIDLKAPDANKITPLSNHEYTDPAKTYYVDDYQIADNQLHNMKKDRKVYHNMTAEASFSYLIDNNKVERC